MAGDGCRVHAMPDAFAVTAPGQTECRGHRSRLAGPPQRQGHLLPAFSREPMLSVTVRACVASDRWRET